MPSLFDHETTVAYLKSVTDEDAEEQLRHPTLWSYIARDPTGMVYSHGRERTRAECERWAIAHAAERAEEIWLFDEPLFDNPRDRPWPLFGWRFLIWPPSAKPGH
jgi:hypothetical protein